MPQDDVRLPNGKKQQDEILKADYEQNVKDAQELSNLARSFEEDLEKDDRFVLSLDFPEEARRHREDLPAASAVA